MEVNMSEFQPHFHQRPQPGRAKDRLNKFLGSLVMMLALLGVYGMAASWDAQAQAEDQIIDAQLRFASERADAEVVAAARVAEAYAQGQRDAMHNLSEPQGMALAQACMAYRLRDVPATFASRKKGV
jgi:hypothetical protein